MINLNATPTDDALAIQVIKRVKALTGEKLSTALASTELIACHLNACPLDFHAMLTRGEDPIQVYDVLADLAGIHHHFDRRTGQLRHGWKPRFRKEA
jgi:hypothetical protein